MGLEAETSCSFQGQTYAVKALLESSELILRGALNRKFAIAALKDVAVRANNLTFTANGETYDLELGAARAATWAKKLASPPPSLASKLGLTGTVLAQVIGPVEDAALAEALKDRIAAITGEAALFIAVVRDESQLKAALKAHAKAAKPLWLINVKGPKSPLGENAIRTQMRAAGYKDTKTCAVSETLSGTRYNC